MSGKIEVLIVGAGPTGLVLALWLTRRGVPVRIIDRAAEPGTTSRALAVQARTLEFYRQLGIADRVIAGGTRIAALNFWVGGERAARVPLERIGEGRSPYSFVLVYPQDAHERLLIEELDRLGVRVERQSELVDFEQRDGGVSARIRRPDSSIETCDAAYIAGCDGASSTVRRQLGVYFPGGTYTGQFYVADVEASGPAVDGELHVDIEDADFLLMFPLKRAGHVRLVGNARNRTEGANDDLTRADDELTLADVTGKAVEHLGLRIDKVNWFSTYRVHHRVAHRFRDRRAFLLGDAAHIHSPVGGQGMNTGIGDAVNLAWKLVDVLQRGASEALLDTYEPERIAFARRLVATTDRAFTFVTRPGSIARTVRKRVVPRVMPKLLRRRFLRRFLFATLSQTSIRYRDSALSAGAAGRIHGGDRLPWGPWGEFRDNFEPLAALDWQVHVYGDPNSGLSDACAQLNLPLHRFPWLPAVQNAGFEKDALYLVRPDGYVALVDPSADPNRLRDYMESLEGRRRVAPDTRTSRSATETRDGSPASPTAQRPTPDH